MEKTLTGKYENVSSDTSTHRKIRASLGGRGWTSNASLPRVSTSQADSKSLCTSVSGDLTTPKSVGFIRYLQEGTLPPINDRAFLFVS